MQNFSTKEVRHEFTVDGAPYYLPGIAIGDFEEMVQLGDMDMNDQIIGFRNWLGSRARKQSWFQFRSPRSAVGKLSPAQCTDLFQAWIGFGKDAGESSASPDSQ